MYTDAHILYEFRVTGGARSRYFEGIVESVLPSGRGWSVHFPEDNTRFNFVWSTKGRNKGRSLFVGLQNALHV